MQDTKDDLRRRIRGQLKAMAADERARLSKQACLLLEKQAVWRKARTIFFYAPQPEELDVWPLLRDSIAAKKTAALPRFDSATGRYVACEIEDLTRDIGSGQFGIREPGGHCIAIPPNRLELILVPGVAFDAQGNRLGRGKGFYDQ